MPLDHEYRDLLVVTKALQRCDDGMDFADALHLASSRNSE
jgi:hypothetical protein